MRGPFYGAVFAVLAVLLIPEQGKAQQRRCTAADLAAVVDETAQALRDLNAKSEQDYQAKLAAVSKERGWSDAERQRWAYPDADDDRLVAFNEDIETRLAQLDALSRVPDNGVDCARLDELQRVRDQLLTIMGQKSGYMIAQLDAAAAVPPAAPMPLPRAKAPAAEPPAPREPQRQARHWETEVSPGSTPNAARPRPDEPPLVLAPDPSGEPPRALAPDPSEQPGYSFEELEEAGRSAFDELSSDFTDAIGYAVRRYGQPVAYIVGTEGGAAFLAGLRYGKGVLHQKDQEPRPVYWQGPSAGLDFGAEGSQAMFLVYNLADAGAILGRFTGVGGSATVVGGVGVNEMSKGDTTVVPIRSGVGLRLGASLSYLKFTKRATWNPF